MKILVIDDDVELVDILALTLRRDGFLVKQAHNGLVGLKMWQVEKPDLVVLDVNMPGMDGFEVCRRIRARAKTPIIMLSASNSEDDISRALDLGANDYIAKPFNPPALLARVRALLGCTSPNPVADPVGGDLSLDPSRQAVRIGTGATVELTPKEYRMLHYLMVNQGQTLPADRIIDHVWGYRDSGDRALLKHLVRRLRMKIEPDPSQPRYIQTVLGIGYRLSVPLKN